MPWYNIVLRDGSVLRCKAPDDEAAIMYIVNMGKQLVVGDYRLMCIQEREVESYDWVEGKQQQQ